MQNEATVPVRTYFYGFNTLRFVAASMVVIHHIEQVKYVENMDNVWLTPIVYGLGPTGVSLFFVLSGFLITYLLLGEYQATGTLHIRKFYVRRILRIWPLYYLIIAISFFLLPAISAFASQEIQKTDALRVLILYMLFLPNIALSAYNPVWGAAQGWSLGVEEQFYLVWPHLIRRFRRSLLPMFIAFVLLRVGANWLLDNLAQYFTALHASQVGDLLGKISTIVGAIPMDKMAVGAIGAYLVFYGKLNRGRGLLWPPVQLTFFLLAVASIPFSALFINNPIYGALQAITFAAVIVSIASHQRAWQRLETRILNNLGKISYGIYMFHVIIIILSLNILNSIASLRANPTLFNNMLYLCSFALTWLVAALSYKFFETPFLRLKARFSADG